MPTQHHTPQFSLGHTAICPLRRLNLHLSAKPENKQNGTGTGTGMGMGRRIGEAGNSGRVTKTRPNI